MMKSEMNDSVFSIGIQNKFLKILVLVLVLGWMAVYPIYTNYYKAIGIEQYPRHKNFLEKKSMFFNPWQYRILCPLLVEVTYQTLDHTLFAVVPVKGVNIQTQGDTGDKYATTQKFMEMLKDPEFVKYTLVFVGFRFLENLLVLMLAYTYLLTFTKNKPLLWFSLLVITLFMGNSVVDSDLAFNTYMDIIVYLAAALVIVRNLNGWWIVPITLIGILNRETSALVPAMYFCSKVDWTVFPNIRKIIVDNIKPLYIVSISYVIFAIVFVLVRMHYGYQPQSTWRVPAGLPMIKLNMFSAVAVKTYMELFGVFGFLPIATLIIYRNMNFYLKVFFLVIVPVWFGIHFSSAIAYQTRLFLVPTIIVFLPAIVECIERYNAPKASIAQ